MMKQLNNVKAISHRYRKQILEVYVEATLINVNHCTNHVHGKHHAVRRNFFAVIIGVSLSEPHTA